MRHCRPGTRQANLFVFVGAFLGNASETPTPTTCLKSTAVHLQFVRQYAPHLYRRAFLASKTLQYASHLYCSTPPICTAVRAPFVRQYFWQNTGGWGHQNVSELFRQFYSKDGPPKIAPELGAYFLFFCLRPDLHVSSQTGQEAHLCMHTLPKIAKTIGYRSV